MDITGQVKEVFEETVNGRNGSFVKHQFVVNTGGEYPKDVHFEVVSDNAFQKMKDVLVDGNDVQVFFNPDSRKFNGRWFTSLKAYGVKLVSGVQAENKSQNAGSSAQAAPAQQPQVSTAPAAETKEQEDNNDDLPF